MRLVLTAGERITFDYLLMNKYIGDTVRITLQRQAKACGTRPAKPRPDAKKVLVKNSASCAFFWNLIVVFVTICRFSGCAA
jgi:hypothetical protein